MISKIRSLVFSNTFFFCIAAFIVLVIGAASPVHADENSEYWWQKTAKKPSVQHPEKTEYLMQFAENGFRWTPDLDETSITEQLDTFKQNGISAVYVDVFSNGETLFPSENFPSRDPDNSDWLQFICAEAAKRNLKIHAWIQVLKWKDSGHNIMQTSHTLLAESFNLLDVDSRKSPLNKSNTDLYVSPALSETTRRMGDFVREVCRYNIDGINFDSLHYNPAVESGYHPEALAQFKAAHNIESADLIPTSEDPATWEKWVQFRKDKLTSLTRHLVSVVKNSQLHNNRLPIPVSLCLIPSPARHNSAPEIYQSWEEWLESGLIDFSTPACHASALSELERELREMRSFHQQRDLICVPDLIPGSEQSHHPNLEDQLKVLTNVGFRYCIIRGTVIPLHDTPAY